MFVCLCMGVTSHTVQEAIDNGARTTNDVARRCGAGSDCGRCRHTLRMMIDASGPAPVERHRRRWRRGPSAE